MFKSRRKILCVPTSFLNYTSITTALLNYQTDVYIYMRDVPHTSCLEARTSISKEYEEQLSAFSLARTHLCIKRSRSQSPDIRPMTRALRISQSVISLLLIFAAPRDPAGALLSNAMGVKRSNCGRTEAGFTLTAPHCDSRRARLLSSRAKKRMRAINYDERAYATEG